MASSGASAASSAPTRGQRAPTFRTTFDSPWRIQWSVLDAKKTEQISRALQSTVRDVKQRDKSAKSVFLVGINHVTRALERGACAAVIVGRDSEYTALVQHLPVQAALADVPCVILPKSLPLREAFLLPRVLAVGLRSPSHNEAAAPSPSPSPPQPHPPSVQQLLRTIQQLAQPLQTPFLPPSQASASASKAVLHQIQLSQQVTSAYLPNVKAHRRDERRRMRRKRRREERERGAGGEGSGAAVDSMRL
ncbi:unnamed protein product [Vitrella brassicaformis CCMP3155]|uniref:Uncharacterized protein n=2 Tax=Vitrella brassicaformis TaxID=1169539 RepID=A0A0G4FZZ7_VITBC|nr:unnamed protein product [Vitrella brassicaformis CCMP3155]|eukprot:CEM20788.1 unnamed protein product [Vitrella brassicaformis CCMP3155]